MGTRYSEVFIEQALFEVYSRGERTVKPFAEGLNVNDHTGWASVLRFGGSLKPHQGPMPLLSLSLNEQVLLYMRLTQPFSL